MTSSSLVRQVRQQALGDLPRRTANRFPDKLAIVNGESRLTFAELEAVIGRTTVALTDAGLSKGDRLALLSHNCWQFPVLSFATARLGVILVPIQTPTLRRHADRTPLVAVCEGRLLPRQVGLLQEGREAAPPHVPS